MEYKQLEFFLAVCEQKSFSRAAEVCYVSQQAISKSLANLEQELGVQLFVRNSGGVALTEAGRLFEQQVRPHLNERDEIFLWVSVISVPLYRRESRLSRTCGDILPVMPCLLSSWMLPVEAEKFR